SISQQLVECSDTRGIDFAKLDALFTHGSAVSQHDSVWITKIVQHFEITGSRISVSATARHAGLSMRQFERRFREAVGISPKLFSRMQRFQHVFHALEGPHTDWVTEAIRCGYFDQAHLIRDFREFTGATPTALLSEEVDLARRLL